MRIGPYDVISQISEGAFGRTFLAKHRVLGVKACLKQEKTGDPIYRKLFEAEARLLWDIHHDSLPTLKDYLVDPDYGQVIAMSFIEGECLEDLVEKRGAIDDEHICWILQRVLDALSYLHHRHVIHCDIKPQNIILDIPEHNAVLVDFGLYAADPDSQTLPKGGTRFYLPPEFLLGLPPLPAADLYSLGMTAVHIAGGDVRTGVLPKDMHPDLQAFIGEMIRRDPVARPQDAGALNRSLTTLRKRVFNRTATLEMFKHRGDKP
jgi:serine/threonine-protein kinase